MLNIKRSSNHRRAFKGQCLVETLVGAMIIVPLLMACLDLSVLVIGGQICNDLSKQAARSASLATSSQDAQTAVQNVQRTHPSNETFQGLSLSLSEYDGTPDGLVSVTCGVDVRLPVPVPFLGVPASFAIQTQHTEPIVGISQFN